MESEKVKEIKKVLEEGQFNTIKHHQHEGKPILISFADILTLINELESENERLKEYRKNHSKTLARIRSENTELKDRIAELEKENAKYKRKLTTNQWVQEIRKEALKQFVERLREKAYPLYFEIGVDYAIPFYKIDETLKEAINEKKNP